MTFEEVKVGDVLYNEEKKQHYMVCWKNDKDREIGGRVSSNKSARVNIGNQVEIGIMSIRNLTFKDPDSFFYEGNKKYLDNCKKVFELSPSALYQFNLFEDFVDDESDIVMAIKDEDTAADVKELMELSKKISELRIKLNQNSKEFITNHYPEVKLFSGERAYEVG